ncbi:hypothetical protein KITKAT_2 [Arthrobacter phage Kitkat]|uniref:Holin n=2 Tax=Kelleziovirus kitkat TaxID=1982238 RepID=A0A140G6S8_9CAUD|nr:hypothetical protein BJD77_gp002 [Arthrobacter phage Kitkat]AMM44363.1 hypothetical protein KITKAT_2 [Arthrobacter phage Kitkat]QGJ96441.1 hypothetical protein SEA_BEATUSCOMEDENTI_2 [Arthrobacter phage BeatusComedenti]
MEGNAMLVFEVDWVKIIQFLLGAVLPGLVGLVTKKSTDGAKKAILLLTLALVQGLLGQILDAMVNHTLLNIGEALLVGLASWILAVLAYYQIYVKTGAADQLQGMLNKDPVIKGEVVVNDDGPQHRLTLDPVDSGPKHSIK